MSDGRGEEVRRQSMDVKKLKKERESEEWTVCLETGVSSKRLSDG